MSPLKQARQAERNAKLQATREYLEARKAVSDDDWRAISRLLAEHQAKIDAANRRYWRDAEKVLDRALNRRLAA